MERDEVSIYQKLLEPLSADAPAGPDLRDSSRETSYARLARQIEDDRRYVQSGTFNGAAADWHAVVREAEKLLLNDSKDLEVATWLVRGLYRTQGLLGLRTGITLLQQLQETFWEALHPVNHGMRKGRLAWLEDKLSSDIRETRAGLPTAAAEDPLPPLRPEQLDLLRQHYRQCSELIPLFGSWREAVTRLYDEPVPDLIPVMRELEFTAEHIAEQLASRDLPLQVETDHSPLETATYASVTPGAAGAAALLGAAGPARSRDEALRQLDTLADYFTEHEPLSPIGPALQRVARWARGSLKTWLAEMIEHEPTLSALYKAMDMNSPEPG